MVTKKPTPSAGPTYKPPRKSTTAKTQRSALRPIRASRTPLLCHSTALQRALGNASRTDFFLKLTQARAEVVKLDPTSATDSIYMRIYNDALPPKVMQKLASHEDYKLRGCSFF